MLGLLSQPKPQSADTAVFTLCDRLTNSLLIEDRKAAVLALRGLAHENRELVASSGLQGLFDVLIKDSHDPDVAKATLETLLILFNTGTRRKVRDKRYISPLIQREIRENSVEPRESITSDISLWLTDRLIHSEDALKNVLELATTKTDPFTAVYALQLISVMASNRPIETKQIMLASGGIAPLVTALGSVQDMVRDEALLLLNALTVDHLDLQKLVAFEGGFDKAFAILKDGGGVVYGGRFAEDCLTLIANLIEYNTSNQKFFTQSGYVAQWANALESIIDAQNAGSPLREQAITNIQSALQIGQLLCVADSEYVEENQNILQQNGVLTLTLQIAFGPSSPPPVRVAALITTASLVNGNNDRQSDLLAIDVPYYDLTFRKVVSVEPPIVPVSQALLNWAVNLSASQLFDLRCASLICLSSAFSDNLTAKTGFVTEQIEKYYKASEIITKDQKDDAEKKDQKAEDTTTSGAYEENTDANLVEVLAEFSDETRLNPFRVWFACAITMRLFINSPEIKEQLRSVKIGDESLGMEVHSLIQAVTGEMQGSLQLSEPVVALGYLQLLAVWLFDDVQAVCEFTRESSTIQTLLAHQTPNPLVESLAIILLGISYSFCKKDSELPRDVFHRLLAQTLGRDQYKSLIRKFEQSFVFKNFDENDMFGAARNSNGSPSVYLDATFVGLMKNSIRFISRAIDAHPDIEPSSRVTFEMLDDVKIELHEKSKNLELAEQKLEELTQSYNEIQEKLENTTVHASKQESLSKEYHEKMTNSEKMLENLKTNADKLESSLKSTKAELDAKIAEFFKLETTHKKHTNELSLIKAAKEKAEEGVNNLTRELFQLQRTKDSLEKENYKLNSELSKLKPKFDQLTTSEAKLKSEIASSQAQLSETKKSFEEQKKVNEKLISKLRDTAKILKQHEDEEEDLRSKLAKLKLETETQSNEFITLKNREASTRKSYENAQNEIEKYKESQKQASKTAEEHLFEIKELKAVADKLQTESKKTQLNYEKSQRKTQELEEKLAKVEKEAESKGEAASKQAETNESSNLKLKEVNMRLVKELADFKAKYEEQLKKNSDISQQQNQDTKRILEISELKNELNEKAEALDELMVLLDDLTEKKTSYKERLRSLKQEVSESEDEGDEDDEDE